MNTYDFFVSYTGEDQKYADWLVFTLEAENYQCVYQARDFVPGENFMEQMREASSNSKTTLALLTPKYLESEFAQMELDAALVADPRGKKGRLLPVRVQECTPDALLRTRVWVDLVGRSPAIAAKELLAGVKAFKLGVRQDREGYFERVPQFPDGPKVSEPAKSSHKPNGEIRLAFLAATAGLLELDLEKEAEIIREVIPADLRNQVAVHTAFEVVADDFYSVLNETRPQIVHFAGSFLATGELALGDGAGGYRKVDLDAAAAMFRCLSDGVDLVVLNACHSAQCAQELKSVVGAAIGIEGTILDRDAINFSRTFYTALWCGRSIDEAHQQACSRLAADNLSDEVIPKLYASEDSDLTKPLVLPTY